ncbi:hypothetical protein GCM10009676_28600 [Prauserella halophila]|uniref:Uncharacterized protein n=1 Tax=Prauserella halophila TaxID=185641 RepID=A0ABN1W9M1_9PSEU
MQRGRPLRECHVGSGIRLGEHVAPRYEMTCADGERVSVEEPADRRSAPGADDRVRVRVAARFEVAARIAGGDPDLRR